MPLPPAHAGHAFYKFYAFVRSARLAAGWSRDHVMAELNERGVPCPPGRLVQRIYLEGLHRPRLGPAARLPGP